MSREQYTSKKKANSVLIDAELRIRVEKDVEKFLNSEEMIYTFSSALTNVERAFVHNLAPKYNLKTKSEGVGEDRRLSLFKLTENNEFTNRSVNLNIDQASVALLKQFKKEFPSSGQSRISQQQHAKQSTRSPFVLTRTPTVPPPSNADIRIQNKRQTLPIYTIRNQILQAISDHRIVLIQGSTGSGKTTQIPQYILEDANERNEPCRILCTQPRRISAIASSERVCYERSEVNNSTVGYQIRLESRLSQDTNCIFLTPGVFLRYLISGEPEKLYRKITHILIDEAHERAKENDFLLTSIKEHFNSNPNLKLIIMSATMDTEVFANYFGACEEISISTKQYDVQEIYLEDILKVVGFKNRRVEELDEMYRTGQLVSTTQSAYVREINGESEAVLDEETKSFLNEILDSLSSAEIPESEFDQFVYLVQAENVPVDFRHETTKMTALMIAVGKGWLSSVDTLLKLKADPSFKVFLQENEISSFDVATQLHGADSDMKKLLDHYVNNQETRAMSSMDIYNKNLVNIYYDTVLKTTANHFVVDEDIDHELIAQLIEKIHKAADTDQAILVFLPGFDDIIQQANLLESRLRNGFRLFLLHSSMKTEDQKNVFKPVMRGTRKIILSTNIAESSITIDDVVFVVDSGREKQKSYDAISHSSSLRVQWISKASANQRKGRAGRLRNGVVYRVYSSDRYNSMLDTTLPELLRNSLTEICLQTKLMIQDTMKIEEFLMKCIATPSIASIRQSIKLLQCLGALDPNEALTLLGSHLAQMPVDAKYAKMMIYGIALKCLDPVLSIVSILSFGDQIFVLPIKPADRYKSQQTRRTVGEGTLSDHFVMLKFFQLWLSQRQNMNERKFCEENFISSNSMEHVRGIRNQIMSYLQSSGLLKAPLNVLNANSNNWPLIKACLCAGLYPNVARVDRKRKTMYSDIDQKLAFHMSSILGNKGDRSMDFVKHFPADWVVFDEKNRVGRMPMIRCNTLVNSFSLTLSAGAALRSELQGNDDDDRQLVVKIDSLVTLTSEAENASLILDLRENLDNMILRMLSSINFKYEKHEDVLISTISKILSIEERKSGFANVNLADNAAASTSKRNDQNWRRRHDENQPVQARPQRNQQEAKPSNPNQNTFFADNAETSWRTVSKKPLREKGFQVPMPNGYKPRGNSREKFFVMKMSNEQAINGWASRIVFDIDVLKLKPFILQKIYNMISTQVYIVFYSTLRSELLGYGDIVSSKDQNNKKPLQFHFRLLRKLSLEQLRNNNLLRNFNAFQTQFQTEELPYEIGSAVLNMLRR